MGRQGRRSELVRHTSQANFPRFHFLFRHKTSHSSEQVQLERLIARDKSNEEAAISRIRSQMPIREKAYFADIVINNDDSVDKLKDKIRTDLIQILEKETRWFWLLNWLFPPLGIFSAALTLLSRAVKRSLSRGNGCDARSGCSD